MNFETALKQQKIQQAKSMACAAVKMVKEHCTFGAFQWLGWPFSNGQSENKPGILEQGVCDD